jgi:hypothetical protein
MTKVLIGSFEGNLNHLTIPAQALELASEVLDEAQRKREHPTLVVDREWLIDMVHDLLSYVDADKLWHDRRGDFDRRDRATSKAGELRAWLGEKERE